MKSFALVSVIFKDTSFFACLKCSLLTYFVYFFIFLFFFFIPFSAVPYPVRSIFFILLF